MTSETQRTIATGALAFAFACTGAFIIDALIEGVILKRAPGVVAYSLLYLVGGDLAFIVTMYILAWLS